MSVDLQDISIHAWIEENGIKNERGELITFKDHYFLLDIYEDDSPQLCVLKAAQIGMSVLQVLKTFWTAKKMAFDIIYTLPTDTDVQVFVGGKVNRIITQNPILQEYCADKDSVFQKAVGESMVYFRSTWSKKQATMITADWVSHDEIDASKQDVVEQYQSRMQHSKYKWKHVFSHPSVPGYGVDIPWSKSDQKHWFIRCKGCKKEQYMDFPESVCFERRVFQCKFCAKELTPNERRKGRWVARYKDREWSGYWVNLLMCPWVKAEEILTKWEDPDTSKEFFFNMMMGKPYQASDGSVSRQDILRNITPDINSQEGVVIGSDSGLKKHYVVGNKEGIFYYGVTQSWDDIRALLRTYKHSILIVDALPDLTAPRELREEFPGRVFLSHYNEDKKSMQLVRWGNKKEEGVVHIDRNRMITHLVEEFKDIRIPLQGKPDEWEDFIKHWLNIYRTKEENKLGKPVFRWEKKTSEDHWCFGKGTMIQTQRGEVSIEKVKVGDMALTREGYKKVLRAWKTRDNANVIKVSLSNGRSIVGTANHKIMTQRGWITIDSLVYGDILESCEKWKRLHSTESNSEDTPNRKRGVKGFIMCLRGVIERRELADSIKKFGKKSMEKFQKDLLFTTKTITRQITRLEIWLLLAVQGISQTTIKSVLRILNIMRNKKDISRRYRNYLINGERQTQGALGILNTHMDRLFFKLLMRLNVLNAEIKEQQEQLEAGNFVVQNVKVVGTEENGEKESVYNLTVEDQHEYFAEGVLVANCHATVYWRAGISRFGGEAKIISPSTEIATQRSVTVSPDDKAMIHPKQHFIFGETLD